jgi:SAM-dependent methyltransferase
MATAASRHGWQLSGSSSDAYEELLVPAIFAPWGADLVGLADLRAGERVLDVACGTGIVARRAVGTVGPGGAVTAVDVNPAMLTTARRSAPSAPGPQPVIDWHEADAGGLPFPDGSFDVVLCQQGLQFFGDQAAATQEMRRVLARPGRMLVAVWRGLDENRPFALFAEAIARHSPTAGDMMRAPFGLGDRERLRAPLARAGFTTVRITVRALICRFPSPEELLRREMLSSPLAGPLGELAPAAMDALIADVDETLQPYVDDDGLAMTMECHTAIALAG